MFYTRVAYHRLYSCGIGSITFIAKEIRKEGIMLVKIDLEKAYDRIE